MSLCMLSNLGSATSNVHIQGSSPSVLHLHEEHIIDCEAQRGVDDGNQGAIKCSQKWPTQCLRRKKTGYVSIICFLMQWTTVALMNSKHVFGHPMKNDIVSSRQTINRYRALCNPSQVWLITAWRGLTSMANVWNGWICCLGEITLYNFTQRRRKLPRLPGTCWPRKLISVLAKLDCTLIWMWSTASRGILLCHRLKTPGQSNKAGSIGA